MPTRIPVPTPRPTRPPAPAPAEPAPVQILASAWLAGLVLLAAIAGASDERGLCAVPTVAAAPAQPASLGADGGTEAAALRDMLAHD